mmetsp:Transcript_24259/g.54551  ORF Transcript_24259/g.54551 Transcript_24259/m.54551 type:complete len:233 (-) Transcript_24259:38-736(-)
MQSMVNRSEGNVDVPLVLGPGQDDLPGHEDEQHNLRHQHAIDEAREQLGLVAAIVLMGIRKLLQTNGEAHIARSNNVLDLELSELRAESELLNDASKLPRRQPCALLALRSCADHLSRGKNQRCCLGLSDSHDHCCKALGVVLGVSGLEGNGLQVQTAVQIHCGNDVLQGWRDSIGQVGIVFILVHHAIVAHVVVHGHLVLVKLLEVSREAVLGELRFRMRWRSCPFRAIAP